MRSEHKTTGDEWDLTVRRFYCYLQRAGVAKSIKKMSHRLDRQAGKRETESQYRDYLEEEHNG